MAAPRKIVTGVTEIGEGILTVLAQIAAEELGVRPEDITIGDNDTARSPEAAHAGATRQTYMIGNSVALACREARGKLDKEIANIWGVETGIHLALSTARSGPQGTQFAHDRWSGRRPLQEARRRSRRLGRLHRARHRPRSGRWVGAAPGRPMCYGCQVAEVEVDTLTGEVQVLGIWAVHDVGRAINPRGVEGQIEGGVVQGLGQALMEDYQLENGHTKTHGFAKYILPTALDIPQINTVIIEDRDPQQPARSEGHRRAVAHADGACDHERDLRRCGRADQIAARDTRDASSRLCDRRKPR